MRKYSFLFLLVVLFMRASAQKLDGAFAVTAAQYGTDTVSKAELQKQHIVKIFKDGYWIATFFGDPKQPFNGTGGGTYTTNAGKYSETLSFYSWDSTAVGKTYTFDYTLNANKYHQQGNINSDKYKDYLIKEDFNRMDSDLSLKNASLEGVWKLTNANWSEAADGSLKDLEQIKIYSYPRFAWAQYNPKTGQFLGAGGGTYQYDGKMLVEHIDYITYDIALGTDYKINTKKLPDGSLVQEEAGCWSRETWKKINSSK